MPRKPKVLEYIQQNVEKQMVDSYLDYFEYMRSECEEFIRNSRNSECIQLQIEIMKGVNNILNADNNKEYLQHLKGSFEMKLEYQKVVTGVAFDKKEKFTDQYYKESMEILAKEYNDMQECIEFLESEIKKTD